MNRRTFFKWATATGAALILPPTVRPTREWKVVEEYRNWILVFRKSTGRLEWQGFNQLLQPPSMTPMGPEWTPTIYVRSFPMPTPAPIIPSCKSPTRRNCTATLTQGT